MKLDVVSESKLGQSNIINSEEYLKELLNWSSTDWTLVQLI